MKSKLILNYAPGPYREEVTIVALSSGMGAARLMTVSIDSDPSGSIKLAEDLKKMIQYFEVFIR